MQHRNSTHSPARMLHLLAAITAIANDEEGVERALPKVLTLICNFTGSPVDGISTCGMRYKLFRRASDSLRCCSSMSCRKTRAGMTWW